MKIGKKGIDLLKKWEQAPKGGFASISYKCSAGKKTIGWGHVITPLDSIVQPINVLKAEELLYNDLKWAEKAVNKFVKTTINQNQFDALVCLVFNIGATNFKDSTLIKVLNEGSLDKVPVQFMRWVFAGKVRLKGLENRRFAEINLWNDKEVII